MRNPSESTSIKLPRANFGERPSASAHNKIVEAIERLSNRIKDRSTPQNRIRLIKLYESAGKTLHVDGDSNPRPEIVDREYKFAYFDTEDAERDVKLEPGEDSYPSGNFADPFGTVHAKDDVLLTFFDRVTGQVYPINPKSVVNAVTWPTTYTNSETTLPAFTSSPIPASYPAPTDIPNVYPIKFVKLTHTQTMGRREPTYKFHFPADECDAYVVTTSLYDTYLLPFTVIPVYNVNDQWFTPGVSTEKMNGITSAAISKGSSGTVRLYVGTDSATDSGIDFTCYNRYADVGSGKKVEFGLIGARYFLSAAEC
jgi:hypothetical protein